MSDDYDFEAEEAKLDAAWKDVEHASAQVDQAFKDYERARHMEQGSSQSESPRRQYSPEEMDKAKEILGKVAEVGFKSVATVTAVAGAGVVSLFKRDSKPISSTFDWCKKTFWGKR